MLDAINRAAVKVLKDPQVVQSIESQSAEVVAGDVDSTNRFFATESVKWKRIVDISGAKVE